MQDLSTTQNTKSPNDNQTHWKKKCCANMNHVTMKHVWCEQLLWSNCFKNIEYLKTFKVKGEKTLSSSEE